MFSSSLILIQIPDPFMSVYPSIGIFVDLKPNTFGGTII